jgi:hypothetical protein
MEGVLVAKMEEKNKTPKVTNGEWHERQNPKMIIREK